MKHYLLLPLLAALAFAGAARASTFTIDPQLSSVTLSGDIAELELSEQSEGSLTTRFQGTLDAVIAANGIQFTGANLDALTNGVWHPAVGGGDGTAPADFGGQGSAFGGTVYGALRGIVLNLTSGAIPTDGSSFDASSIVFSIPAGAGAKLDYNAGFFGSASKALDGNATNSTATVGTITTSTDSGQTISLNIDATFVFTVLSENDTSLTIRGQIVATSGANTGAKAMFTSIKIMNNEAVLTLDNPGPNSTLQSSTDLVHWTNRQPQVTPVDADTVTYTLPVNGAYEFYRLLQ